MDRKFELFEIMPNVEKLRELRKSYIDSLEGNICFKVISNRRDWFSYRDGIFDVNSVLGNKFFEFGLSPVKSKDYSSTISNFIQFGPTDMSSVKGLTFNGESYYVYTTSRSMNKHGKRYSLVPVIPISYDIYNLSLISLLDFERIELDDISMYSSYFNVCDNSNFMICESRLEDLYRSGSFSALEYQKMLKRFDKEENLVRSLRKK